MQPSLNTTVRRTETGIYEFSPHVVEINVLDRLGKPVWTSGRQNGGSQIRWSGVDLYGHALAVGNYMFKVICPDNQAYYLPFIHAD